MRQIIFLIAFAVITVSGCSSGSNPSGIMMPSQSPGGTPDFIISNSGTTALMGSYELSIDKSKMTADLVTKRLPSIGESYIVNGIGFFTMSPCTDCLKIKSIALTLDNLIQMKFAIKHPFPPGDIYKPPSGKNRLDLDIFDVALLVHPVDSSPDSWPLTGAEAYPGVLVNNAGYSTELSNVISDPAALPFVLVLDDNSSSTNTFNKFAMGSETTFDTFFNPTGTLNFDLYLTMGYGASAKKAQRLTPTYYNPEFNRKSAWKVVVNPPNGTNPPVMGNTWNDADTTTPFDVTVQVFDWQIDANVDPTLTNTTDVYASSEVSSVSLEIPGMSNSLVTRTAPSSGTGTPSDPLIYTLSVANQNQLSAGEYYGLVKVSDERTPGQVITGGETDTMADSPNGIQLNWVNIPEFATYQVFTATVVIGCGPVTGSITSPSCPVTGISSGSTLDFDATASSGNGGDPVVLYEWDSDYNGSTFDIDATGPSVTLGPFINPNCGVPPEDPVTYTVAVRGTDSCDPPNVTVFATCNVTVDNCTPVSVGNIILTVNRLDQTGKYAINTAGPFTLSWDDPAVGYAEYAIYKDNDPADGLLNNLQAVGTTTSLTFTDNISSFPTNHYITGWTYIVRGRMQAGNPSSEGLDSEPAFITFNGWETLPRWSNPGRGNTGEGWVVNHETQDYSDSTGLFYPRVTDGWWSYPSQGIYSCQFTPWCGPEYMPQAGRWNGILKETPDVPDSSVRELTFEMYLWQNCQSDGMSIGTCPDDVMNFFDSGTFEWAQSYSTGNFSGYNRVSSDVFTYFNNVPSGSMNAWIYTGAYNTAEFKLYGGDCNNDGNPADPFVGIEYIKYVDYGQPYPMLDEVAIAIY